MAGGEKQDKFESLKAGLWSLLIIGGLIALFIYGNRSNPTPYDPDDPHRDEPMRTGVPYGDL